MTIKFEIAKGFEDKGINLPKRSTTNAAGYDFEVAEDVTIVSIWKKWLKSLLGNEESTHKPTLVETGVKADMESDMYLALYARSSLFKKKGLILSNSVGVIDSDYYGNPDNDGHILFAFINFGFKDITLKKGERVGQGVFHKFYKTEDDEAGAAREGGFGSTDK